jgi:hypothetical protein
MAGGAYGTVVNSGRAHMASGKMSRRGPGKHKIQSSRVSKPNPAGEVRSMAGSIKGPDKGAGGR